MTTAAGIAEQITAQRIVLPHADRADAMPLYVNGAADVIDRRALRIAAGADASFDTYFNAFPSGFWRTHSTMTRLLLRLDVEGECRVVLRGSHADGTHVELHAVDASTSQLLIEVPNAGREYAWVWLVVSASTETVVRDGEWVIEASERREVRPSIAITTMNRVDDCVRLVDALSSDGLPDLIERVVVVDQGSTRIREAIAPVLERAAVDVKLIEQANLGGSGGFSRGMIEALGTEATHVLLLDDDVMLETESVRKMCALASVARATPLIGAQMLSLREPTVLHSMGEVVDRRSMWWHATEPDLVAADLREHPIVKTAGFLRPKDVDFNGWWMCLIPAAVIREIGVSLPYFIKWDDAEYGLRASAAGHRTLTLPGAALWHMPWTAKDDGLDWQAYHQLRNRVVTALLHSSNPLRLLVSSWAQDVNHVLCQQYGSADVRSVALRDVLDGPAHLWATLGTRRSDMQRLLASRGQTITAFGDSAEIPDKALRPAAPDGLRGRIVRLVRVLLAQLGSVDETAPPTRVRRTDGKWWSIGMLDRVALESAAGDGVFLLQRDRRTAARLLMRSGWLRLRLLVAWPALARRYRRAAPDLARPAAWERAYSE